MRPVHCAISGLIRPLVDIRFPLIFVTSMDVEPVIKSVPFVRTEWPAHFLVLLSPFPSWVAWRASAWGVIDSILLLGVTPPIAGRALSISLNTVLKCHVIVIARTTGSSELIGLVILASLSIGMVTRSCGTPSPPSSSPAWNISFGASLGHLRRDHTVRLMIRSSP